MVIHGPILLAYQKLSRHLYPGDTWETPLHSSLQTNHSNYEPSLLTHVVFSFFSGLSPQDDHTATRLQQRGLRQELALGIPQVVE